MNKAISTLEAEQWFKLGCETIYLVKSVTTVGPLTRVVYTIPGASWAGTLSVVRPSLTTVEVV